MVLAPSLELRAFGLHFARMSTLGKRKLETATLPPAQDAIKAPKTLASIFNPNRTRLIWNTATPEGLKLGTYGQVDQTRKKVAAFDLVSLPCDLKITSN